MVYADILVVLNFIVDYFLILAAGAILRRKTLGFRRVLGALIGGISSLYIFLPPMPVPVDGVYKIFICAVSSLAVFGWLGTRQYIRSVLVLFGVTFAYAGSMLAVLHIFKPNGMLINNSVVYFGISPLVLVASTVAAYLCFTLVSYIFRSTATRALRCEVTLFAEDEKIKLSAIADTGNSLSDGLFASEIIIADKSAAVALLGETDIEKNLRLANRYRLIPCSTVSGQGIMEAYRCDKAVVTAGGRTITLNKPLLAVSKIPLNDGYDAIINPEILD